MYVEVWIQESEDQQNLIESFYGMKSAVTNYIKASAQ